jgi:predicted helicase
VKFIAFAMKQVEETGFGVIGYITSNSWLDSPTFRGVRAEISDSFPVIRVLDLHGNIKKKEIAADGTRDEGVFAIEEGTNITIATKLDCETSISQSDLLGALGTGTGDGKISKLEQSTLSLISNPLSLIAPFYLLIPSSNEGADEYFNYPSFRDIFTSSVLGYQTHRDQLVVSQDKPELLSRLGDFVENIYSDSEIAEKYRVPDKAGWSVSKTRDSLRKIQDISSDVITSLYRPFDSRWIHYSKITVDRPRRLFLDHILKQDNLCIGAGRQGTAIPDRPWELIFVSTTPIDANVFRRGGIDVAPLWLRNASNESSKRPNIDRPNALALGRSINLAYIDGITRGESQKLGNEFRLRDQNSIEEDMWDGRGDLKSNFGPRDMFDYIYAVLHSPDYRTRYAEFLKSDFPRIPTPKTKELFAQLVPLGQGLVSLHLVKPDEAPVLSNPEIRFTGKGEARVEKGYPKYENGKVMINTSRWFEDVPRETWEFHIGGYQVCHKWLKDRSAKGGKNPHPGRILTDEDIMHYRRTVTALTDTRRIMTEIDQAIKKHGGWPGAFIGSGEAEGDY